jgi:uncharacterized protein YheU (UPF0270 family)
MIRIVNRDRGRRWGLGVLALAVALLAGGAAPARATGLERALLKQAPAVLRYLKAKHYQNVGVLKFRVKKGKEPLTDNAGTLNLDVADRLELALVLANDVRRPIGIVHEASAVAARLPGANHLSPEGRLRLFDGRYPLAWGKEEVTPDAFLTGVVQVDPDMRNALVGILAFDRRSTGLDRVAIFRAPMDAETLVETGESFLLRGGFDGGREQLTTETALATATRVKKGETTFPLADPSAPVELEVRYDGKPAPVSVKGGQALVAEPGEGQKVTFVLKRKGTGKDRLGVVLKVNGESTLYRQKLHDLECTKWILDPGDPPITVAGYQATDQSVEAFRVLSGAASRSKEINYGTDVGTITLVVFREAKDAGKVEALTDDAEDLIAVTRGTFPEKPAANLAALRAQLRADASRGLIAEGQRMQAGIRRLRFEPDPVPVLSAAIKYYHP